MKLPEGLSNHPLRMQDNIKGQHTHGVPVWRLTQEGLKLCLQVMFSPLTRKEMKAVYSGVAGAKVGVDFGGFVEAMGNCVLEALSKPAFAHLYPTDAAKVTVLLETWGLADAQKLRNVRR